MVINKNYVNVNRLIYFLIQNFLFQNLIKISSPGSNKFYWMADNFESPPNGVFIEEVVKFHPERN